MQARQSALTYCYATLFPGLSKQLNIAKDLKKALKEGRSKKCGTYLTYNMKTTITRLMTRMLLQVI